MGEFVVVILVLWVIWCVSLLLMMALARPNFPCFTGFRMIIPDEVVDKLTHDELVAIILHEYGHMHHLHVWKNFFLACLFKKPSSSTRLRQELEADDFAMVNHHGLHLASALKKLSMSSTDDYRAIRLELYSMARGMRAPQSLGMSV